MAKPVVAKARPVVDDLRPLVGDVNAALPDLRETTKLLEPVTASLPPYLDDLGAFVYQTNSVTSLYDANGGILRGLLQVTPSTLPLPGAEILSGPTPR